MRLNKIQLDQYSTILGFIGSLAVILGQYDVIPYKTANMVGAIAGLAVSYLVQKPAENSPTTEDLEENR